LSCPEEAEGRNEHTGIKKWEQRERRNLRGDTDFFSSFSFSMLLGGRTVRSFFSSAMSSSKKVDLSEDEWKVKLSPAQFKVLREKGTEKSGTGT
jgi:hypothetical protein